MRALRCWQWLIAGTGLFTLAALAMPNGSIAAERAAPPEKQADKASEKAESPIDWDKAKSLHGRNAKGEKLSADEQAYLDRAKAALARGEGPGKPPGDRPAGAAEPIDMQKARALLQKEQKGEKLTDEEKAYLERAKAQRGGGGGRPASRPATRPANAGRPVGGAPPPRDSTGMLPLPQLGTEKYKGFDGGLYGGGKNEPPAAHAAAAADAAAKVVPLDKDGKPDPAGKVALLAIGMSNTTQEFGRFMNLADREPAKSRSLVLVDGAQGGRAGEQWASQMPGVWEEADRRIGAANVTPKQVQVVWIKQAEMGPARLGEFPDHAKVLQKNFETIVLLAKKRYPNLRLAYLSSRIYAGYATGGLNPEPFAYEGAFAVRWAIEKQIAGDASLNHDAAKGEVKAPVMLWGPYLWADGVKGRQGDDLVYTREDLGKDGTHPSDAGKQKVAEQLLKFFKSDPTAKVWFAKK